jgi:hypothetical protein
MLAWELAYPPDDGQTYFDLIGDILYSIFTTILNWRLTHLLNTVNPEIFVNYFHFREYLCCSMQENWKHDLWHLHMRSKRAGEC